MTTVPKLQGNRLPAFISGAPKPIADAAATYTEYRAEALTARTELAALEKAMPQAEAADGEALAAALRDGSKDPGNKYVAKLHADTEAARRTAMAWTDNANVAWATLESTLIEHLPAWRDHLTTADAQARATVADAIASTTEAVAVADTVASVTTWLDRAERAFERKRSIPTGTPSQQATLEDYAVRSDNGNTAVATLVAALTAWTEQGPATTTAPGPVDTQAA